MCIKNQYPWFELVCVIIQDKVYKEEEIQLGLLIFAISTALEQLGWKQSHYSLGTQTSVSSNFHEFPCLPHLNNS